MTELLRTRVAAWVLLGAVMIEVFLVSPLMTLGWVPLWAGAVGSTITLIAAAIALRGRRGSHAIVAAVVLLAVASRWGHLLVGAQQTELVQAAATLLACGLFATLFLVDVFSAGRLPSRLFSVLLAYLFMGVAWAGAYHCAEILNPGSLSLPGTHHAGSEFLYFSFATLTSVGYGDVLPVGPLVRSMAVLEALTGQLYLVLVVSRFVGERVGSTDSSSA